jgi:hypothetical protein
MDPQFTDDLRELGEAIDDLAGETSYIMRRSPKISAPCGPSPAKAG